MGLDSLGLLTKGDILLGLNELLDESIILATDGTSRVSSSLSGVHEIDDFLGFHLKKFVEFVTSENLLLEWLFLGNWLL